MESSEKEEAVKIQKASSEALNYLGFSFEAYDYIVKMIALTKKI